MKRALVIALFGIGLGIVSSLAPFGISSLRAADAPPSLSFVDEQGQEHSISVADLAKLPRIKANVPDRDNQSAEYEGVRLSDLLQAQGVVLGKDLRGPRIANYVLLEAGNGYRVTLALAEVDPATTDKVVLLADRKNGEALPEKERPWRIIIPDDKRATRWIWMLARISVQSPPAAKKSK